MSKPVQFVVAAEEMTLLGTLVPVAKSPISPFLMPAATKASVTAPVLALRLGLADQGGALTGDAQRTLDVLATAKAYARTFLKEPNQIFEQVIYHALDGGPDVSVTTTNEGLRVEDPAPVEQVLESLRQHFGASVLRSFDFQAEVGREDALVVAALVDSHRRRVLAALAAWGELDRSPYTREQVLQAIASVPLNTQWLAYAIRGMYKDQIQIDADGVGASFERLSSAGLTIRSAGGVLLAEKLAWMAGRMLVMDRILHIEAGRATTPGGVTYAGFSCFQAGAQDLLYVEKNDRTVVFDSPSPAAVFELAGHFLTDPEAIKEADERTLVMGAMPGLGGTSLQAVPLNLQVVSELLSGKRFSLTKAAQAGRSPDNDVVLEEPHVSRQHARFTPNGDGSWSVEDLGSANGTLVNDERIQEPVRLKAGDRVRLSGVVLEVL